MWTVVEFLESQTVEAVPNTWIRSNICFWPNLGREKVIADIKRNALPDTNWPTYQVRVFKDATYDNYLTARKKCKKAEMTSDLNSDTEKRKIIRKQLSSSDSESDYGASYLPCPPSLNKQDATNSTSKNRSAAPEVVGNHSAAPEVVGNHSAAPEVVGNHSAAPEVTFRNVTHSSKGDPSDSCTNCCAHMQKIEKYLVEIVKSQGLIRAQQLQLAEDIQMLRRLKISENPSPEAPEFLKEFSFPLKNEEELEMVEEYLKLNQAGFPRIANELSKIGGNSLYDYARRCLTRLMENGLASEYSYFGAKKKKAFNKLKLTELLIGQKYDPETSTKEMETAIQKWLRRAKERLQNKKE